MPPAVASPYLASQVQTASPAKLRLMLIEAALRHAARARTLPDEAKPIEATDAIIKCQEIVGELIAGIDRQQASELADKIVGLYLFVHGRLVSAAFERNAVKLAEAVRVLEIERDTWRQVCEQLNSRAAVPAPNFSFNA